jgi:hypothetical protein
MAAADASVCPSCGETIEPRPTRRRKCPSCREWITVRGDKLLSPAQSKAQDARPPEGDGKEAPPAEQPDSVDEAVQEQEEEDQAAARFADFKVFRSSLSPWETIFQQAADFATQIGRERILSISHSEANGDAVVTVWYWREALEVEDSGPDAAS